MTWKIPKLACASVALLLATGSSAPAKPPAAAAKCPQPAHETPAGLAALREVDETVDCIWVARFGSTSTG